MSEIRSDNKRIAKNTILLYIRMLVTMFVGLYTSRVVLATLGISDYGLYNVVGGFVSMLSFLSGSMANGTQRFLSFSIGEGNEEKLKTVFSSSLFIHLLIVLIILILVELFGPWFVSNKMTIPYGREFAAQMVLQFSIIAFMFSIIQVPFMSSLIAHEKMDIYAYMSIYDVTMKLLIVYLIQRTDFDKLILYAGLVAAVQISDVVIYVVYCRRKYPECQLCFRPDKQIFKEMLSFSGWTLIGMAGSTTNGQGVNILLNMFWGTVINAARGVAVQVNSVLVGFARNFQVAANPQIIKLYADGKVDEMTTLALRTARFSAYLMIILMLPFLLDLEYILKIWLGEYPPMTPTFLRIVLIQSLIQTMSGPVVTVTFAGGKMKMPNLTAGLCILAFLPITYVAIKLGASPTQVFIINILPWLIECYCDAYYAQKYTGFSMKRFYLEVYSRVFVITGLSIIVSYLLSLLFDFSPFVRFIAICATCLIVSSAIIFLIGLKGQERGMLRTFIIGKFRN